MRTLLALIALSLGCTWALHASAAPPSSDPRASEVPQGLDLSLRHPSEQRRFIVSIHPTRRQPGINRMHNWTVSVLTPDGKPVEGAVIGFEGGMPAHDHGFPTQPRVTRSISPGTYLIEGVKFNMIGWWEFVFEIRTGDVADRARFNLVIRE